SPATARARTPCRPRSASTASASAERLRYETATSDPADASIRAVAAPTPRDPPVTRARRPASSMAAMKPLLDELAHDVADGEVELLGTGPVIRRQDQGTIHQRGEGTASTRQQGDRAHAGLPGGLRRPHQVRGRARGAVEEQDVALCAQGPDLAGEHLLEPE